MILVAIDPGRDAGVALFVGGRLVGARLVNGLRPSPGLVGLGLLSGDAEIAVEIPVLYPGGRSRAPGGDLITLAYRAGRLVEAVDAALGPRNVKVVELAPAAWKAQVPPTLLEARIRERLDADELALVEGVTSPTRLHNVLDAVGLGLFRLKRMGRGGT